MKRLPIVLVHGAWCSAEIWSPLRNARPDIAWIDVQLRSSQHSDATLVDDIEALISACPNEPFTLLAHSYGGAVAAAAASKLPYLDALIFLSALVPHVGESSTDAARRWPGRSLLDDAIVVDGPTLRLDPAMAGAALFGDVIENEVAAYVAQLSPQSLASFSTPRPDGIWEGPVTYIVCTNDRALDPALQRLQIPDRATIIEMPSDHSPMVSHPEELADLVAGAIEPGIDRVSTLLK